MKIIQILAIISAPEEGEKGNVIVSAVSNFSDLSSKNLHFHSLIIYSRNISYYDLSF